MVSGVATALEAETFSAAGTITSASSTVRRRIWHPAMIGSWAVLHIQGCRLCSIGRAVHECTHQRSTDPTSVATHHARRCRIVGLPESQPASLCSLGFSDKHFKRRHFLSHTLRRFAGTTLSSPCVKRSPSRASLEYLLRHSTHSPTLSGLSGLQQQWTLDVDSGVLSSPGADEIFRFCPVDTTETNSPVTHPTNRRSLIRTRQSSRDDPYWAFVGLLYQSS